jgi:signal transduction histidine kinase
LIQAEEALRQSEAQNRAILSAIPDLMFRASADGVYLGYVTTNVFKDLMPTDLQPIGRSVMEILPLELAQKRIRCIQQALKTHEMQIYEQEMWIKDQLHDEEVRIVVSGENEVLVMIRDISVRKQAERELLQKNQQLADTLEQLTMTQQGLIHSEKLAALGQLIAGIAHEINTPLGAIRAASSNTAKALAASWNQLPQLFQRLSTEQQASFFALLDRASNQQQQTTAREKRAWRRSLTEQLEAHHIGNARMIADTLSDIGIYDQIEPFLGLLQDENADFTLQLVYNLARLQGNSRNIAIAVERAAKVVFALKNYARYDTAGQKIPAQLTDGLETVLTLYHNQLKQGVEVIRNYEPLPPILCYPDELIQVWTNLIHNAIQAMEGKGTLEISFSQLLAPDPTHPDTTCTFAVVSITDNGSGIPPDVMPRIFEPFFTTKPTGEGSGLGLDISRKIIDRHAGQITVESQPGLTTFQVWLPKD